jgi:hypothetical protein
MIGIAKVEALIPGENKYMVSYIYNQPKLTNESLDPFADRRRTSPTCHAKDHLGIHNSREEGEVWN